MEPYSADKIKRKKRKYQDLREEFMLSTDNIVIPFNLIVRRVNDLYEGSEKIPFKKRNHDFQEILRDEFD